MFRACHTPRQPLQNYPPGHLGGWQRKCWMDNIKDWTSLPMPELLTTASCRKDWKRISAESPLVSPRRPNRPRDWTELNRLIRDKGQEKGLTGKLFSEQLNAFVTTGYRRITFFWVSFFLCVCFSSILKNKSTFLWHLPFFSAGICF